MLFNTALPVSNHLARQVVKCTLASVVVANTPVGVYLELVDPITPSDPYTHKLMAMDGITIDANTLPGRWGVVEVAGAIGDLVDVVVQGKCKLASGGTLNNLVTGISDAGAITDATPGVTNIDLAIAVSLDADEIYIY